jgi:flagellar biosynthesis protein FliP
MKRHLSLGLILTLVFGLLPVLAQAAPELPAITATNTARGTQYSLTLQLLALMTTLSVLPSLLLMMTAFVRIVIVMSLLRQALGTGQTPPNMVIVGLSLFLTLFVMTPVLTEVYQTALLPYMNQGLSFDKALAAAETAAATAKTEADAVRESLTGYEARITKILEAKKKEIQLPKAIETLLAGKTPAEQLDWLTENAAELTKAVTLPPSPGNGNGTVDAKAILAASKRTF